MTLDRVYNFIATHEADTIVFINCGRVCCTQVNSKIAPTVLKNKSGQYVLIGIYTKKVQIKFVEDDLLAMGVWE